MPIVKYVLCDVCGGSSGVERWETLSSRSMIAALKKEGWEFPVRWARCPDCAKARRREDA
jgi:hypothetical protein